MRRLALGFLLLNGLSRAALAAPATPEEATRLTALVQAYLPAVVRPALAVAPRGDAYALTLDLGRAVAPLAGAGVSLTAGDLAATLTPQADGRWAVRVDGLPTIGLVADGQATSWQADGYTADGVFDPAMRAFTTLSWSNRGSTTRITGKPGTSLSATVTGTTTGSSTAVPAGEGLATVTARSDGKAVAYDMTVPGGSGASEAVKMKAAVLGSTFAWERMPTLALDALWRFLAAHSSRAALIAAQPELKERLRAVVLPTGPFETGATLEGMAVDTRLGTFAVDRFQERLASTAGSTPSFSISFAGLSLPAGLAPPFAAPLVPTGLDLGLSYGPLDLATAARGAIDAFDLAATPPIPDPRGRALAAAMVSDAATLTLAPGSITLPAMTVKFQGVARFTKPLPAASVTVSASGLDRTIAAIRATGAEDPMGKQAITLLLAAKALARAEGADSYAWEIESLPSGSVTVNGTSLADFSTPAKRP